MWFALWWAPPARLQSIDGARANPRGQSSDVCPSLPLR